ncbi:MAG: MFS transporter, partial [Ruminococcus sp.]|nr:MFS transporter [Ruminococcus sp.]
MKSTFKELKSFFILWFTQSFSALGSQTTSFALVIWSYKQSESALTTSLLTVSSYAPYVLVSIFAGVLSDKWNKKITMLVSDSIAALCTITVLILMKTDCLQIYQLYIINAMNGLMNSIQQPASDVTVTLLTPKKHYQKASAMRSFSNSAISLLSPMLGAWFFSVLGLDWVIFFDLITFFTAFLTLLFFIKIPDITNDNKTESVMQSAKNGLRYLKYNRGILGLILFLAAINFTASIYESALPARIISDVNGGENILGAVNACT